MSLFIRELKANNRFTLLWGCAMSAWIILLSLFYPAFSQNAQVIAKAINNYPEAVRELLGLSQNSLSSYLGFYTFVFNGVLELGVIQAVILGSSIIFKEVSGKTADFLFAKPITRNQVMTSKLSAAGISLAITTLICTVISTTMSIMMSSAPVNIAKLLLIIFSLFFIQLIFMTFGVLIATIFVQMKSGIAVSLAALLASQIIYDIFKPIMGGYSVRYLVPIKYFSTDYLIQHVAYEIPFVMMTLILIAINIFLSYKFYQKKDIHAA